MGITKYIMLAALAAATPTAVTAQEDRTAPVLQDFRLDPSRDTNRPRAPERAGPEIGPVPDAVPLPSVAVPPVVTPPVVAPPVAITTRPPAVAPAGSPAPAPPRPEAQPGSQPLPAPPTSPTQPAPTQDEVPAGTEALESVTPTPVAPPAPTQATEPEDALASPLPWILAGVAFLLIVAFLLRRKKRANDLPEPAIEALAEPSPAAHPEPQPPAPRDVTPSKPVPLVLPEPAPAASTEPLTLMFTPIHARTTMAGAQLGYRLVLQNRTHAPIEGLAITAFIANADASQPQMLAAFFDDPFAPEAHRVAGITAGEEIAVSGELRLHQFVPTKVQGRALLIPLVAFKVISLDGDEMARGAFIVGQESTPPRTKMAPFRLDQGPRQFRDIGSRPAQDLIAA